MWTSKPKARLSILTLGITTSFFFATPLAATEEAWDLLYSVRVEEVVNGDEWRAEKTFPDELAAARDDFEIEGYLVPIIAQAEMTILILSEYPADCPFCGGGGYGPGLEVHMRDPLPDMPEFSPLRVRGTLEFIDDPETFQAYVLKDAVQLESTGGREHLLFGDRLLPHE
ncbi:MAG: hypothetical protein AAGA87_08470 [Pseudomonadota bacterium]